MSDARPLGPPAVGSIAATPESGWMRSDLTHDVPLATSDARRYELRALVGQGGMGQIVLAWDRVLEREVAVKQVRPDLPDSAWTQERLAAEARITARLEHPGIVAVHDAGLGDDGVPFYVMRLVRGRSLSEVIAATPSQQARLAHSRDLLTAVQALAFAHSRGVIHRDIKPSNIMLGEHGEVQVMDWGLAVATDQDAMAKSGGGVGTHPYMSPQQERGDPVTIRADVWSLGVVLLELCLGHVPTAADLIVGGGAAGAPPELSAIIARCLAPEAEARYADAAALAKDLADYLDGHRVGAYDYPLAALVRRALRRWRVPLAIAGVALVILVGVLIAAAARVVAERDEASRNLASMLSGRAVLLAAQARLHEAQAVASLALLRDPSLADARGVLMARTSLPKLASRWPLPPRCSSPRLDADATMLLCTGDGLASLYDVDDEGIGQRWSRQSPATNGVILQGRHLALLVDVADRFTLHDLTDGDTTGATGPWIYSQLQATRDTAIGYNLSAIVVLDPLVARSDEAFLSGTTRPCANNILAIAVAPDESSWVAACDSGEIRRTPLGGVTGPDIGHLDNAPHLSALAVVGDDLVWGSARAEVGLYRLADKAPRALWTRSVARAVTELRVHHGVIVARLEGGQVHFISLQGDDLASLPLGSASLGLELRADGRIVTLGDAIRVWDPPTWAPYRLVFGPGVTAAVPSPDDARTAVGLSDGRVVVVAADGQRLGTVHPNHAVPRPATWTADSKGLLGAWSVQPGAILIDTETWSQQVLSGSSYRSVATIAGQRFIGISWGADLAVFAPERKTRIFRVADVPFNSVAVDRQGRWVALGADTLPLAALLDCAPRHEGGAEVEGCDPTPRWLPLTGVPKAIDLSADGRLLVVATRQALDVIDCETGVVYAVAALDNRVHALALSPDGHMIASAHDDGAVRIWDVPNGAAPDAGHSRPRAILRGHRERVASIAYTADGSSLVSASWDGTTRWWTLAPLGYGSSDDLHGFSTQADVDAMAVDPW